MMSPLFYAHFIIAIGIADRMCFKKFTNILKCTEQQTQDHNTQSNMMDEIVLSTEILYVYS